MHRLETLLNERGTRAENTEIAYQSRLRYLDAWAAYRETVIEIPPDEKTVFAFLNDHMDHGKEVAEALYQSGFKRSRKPIAFNTVRACIAALASECVRLGLPSLLQSPRIRSALRIVRKEMIKQNLGPMPKDPMNEDTLFFVLREIPGDTLTGIRDRAMLTFAYCSGGRRRSEIANAQWEHIRWAPRGFHLYIPRSKGDQTGKGFWVAAYGLAFRMLRLWLDVSGIESGPIFRTIQPDGDIGGKALEPDSIYRIFRSHFQNAGLGPSFSPHSLRAGFVVDACRRGVDIQSIRDLTGHGDLRSIQPYMRRGKLEKNPGAMLISHRRLT